MKSMLKIATLLLISSSLSGCIVADHRGHHAPPPHYDWHQGSNAPHYGGHSHGHSGNGGNHHR